MKKYNTDFQHYGHNNEKKTISKRYRRNENLILMVSGESDRIVLDKSNLPILPGLAVVVAADEFLFFQPSCPGSLLLPLE